MTAFREFKYLPDTDAVTGHAITNCAANRNELQFISGVGPVSGTTKRTD